MNLIDTSCIGCQARIQINAAEMHDITAHICGSCAKAWVGWSDDLDDAIQETESPKPSRCECGSEAVGSQFHSDYCPKYKEQP